MGCQLIKGFEEICNVVHSGLCVVKRYKVAFAVLAVVVVLTAFVWWIMAPRYIDLSEDVIASIPECAGVEMSHANESFESYEEMRRLSDQRQACAKAKGRYFLKNRSRDFWERISKPPKVFDSPPGV